MAKLTNKQQQFYSAMEGTFRSPGWKLISDGWKEERDSLAQALFFNAKTMEDLSNARVRYGLLNELVQLPEVIAQQRANIEDDAPTGMDYE